MTGRRFSGWPEFVEKALGCRKLPHISRFNVLDVNAVTVHVNSDDNNHVRKTDAGLAMAGEVASLAPADLETQRYAARLFWANQRLDDTARLFWTATEKVPAPNSRGARLCYLDFWGLSPHPVPA